MQDHIAALQKKGYLSLCQNRSRSIRVLKDERMTVHPVSFGMTVPVYAATLEPGRLPLEEDTVESRLELSVPFLSADRRYGALVMPDDAMAGAGILKGDTVIFALAGEAESGQLAAVCVDNRLLIRRYVPEANRVRLQSENEAFPSLFCQSVIVVGTFAGLIRGC